MKFLDGAMRLGRMLALQADQTVALPWFLPLILTVSAFGLSILRLETALPLLIVATAVDRYRFDFSGAGVRLEHFIFAGVALGWFVKTRPRWDRFHFTRADTLLVAYLALALIVSILSAPQVGESFKFWVLMVFGAAMFWLVRAIAAEIPTFVRGVWTLVIVGVGASLFGIVAWLVHPLGINLGVQSYSLENFATVSPFGTMFDSNTLGMYAMAATLLQVSLLLDAEFSRWRVWLGIGTLITLAAVALSLTRVAWIGLGFGLVLILLTNSRRRWAFAVGGAALGLVVVALLANSALAGGGNALAEFSVARVLTSQSIFFRLDAYSRAWNDFLLNPMFGNGVNVFAQHHTSPAGTRDWISNFFLMTLHDTGVVGLCLLLAWLLWLGAETWKALRRSSGVGHALLLALSIAYLALLVAYQATTVFWLGFNWVYLGLVGAGTMVVRRNEG